MHTDVILTYRKTQFREIPLESLEPGYYQPRQQFSKEGLESLAQTIRGIGILEPLAVRVSQNSPERYEIIAGERRFRAAKLVGLATAPCIIANYSDEEAAQIALIENTCRQDLDPISKAKAMQRLIDDFKYTHEQLGTILGVSRTAVTNQVRLLTLDPRIQVWMYQGELAEGHGKVLAGVAYDEQYALAYKCCLQDWSVRTLEQALQSSKEKKPTKEKIKSEPETRMSKIEEQMSAILGCPVAIKMKKEDAGYFRIDFPNSRQMQLIVKKITE